MMVPSSGRLAPPFGANMHVKNHRVEGLPFKAARHVGGIISPSIVILHDTAGRLTKGNSAAYLRYNEAKVSVHFILERDGTIEQQVETNRRAGHAGQSSYHGRADCNAFSIGIEIVNPGRMTQVAASPLTARAWWKQTFVDGDPGERGGCDLVSMTTAEHGSGVWMDYTPEQIASLAALLEALFRDIPTLKDITTHWYVSPGRKADTNPLFPLDAIRAKILGRDDPAEIEAEAQSHPATDGMVFIGPKSGLNMRRWPSINPNIIAAIPHGEIVPVLRTGTFDGREWHRVLYSGHEGWVVAAYTQPVS